MRYLFGFMCVLALGVMGCSETSGDGGGNGGACVDNVCPCTEAGIRAAIAEGGGLYTFDCGGPTTVVTEATIVIDNDVILDGEGNLTVVGDHANAVFEAISDPTELRGFVVIGEGEEVINNNATLTLTDCRVSGGQVGIRTSTWAEVKMTNSTVSENGIGIWNDGVTGPSTSELTNSTVSGNTEGGIVSNGTARLTNSTVSGNAGFGIQNNGTAELTYTTVSGNAEGGIVNGEFGTLTVANSVIDGDCSDEGDVTSNGYNIESPGDTCGFDQTRDQVSVTAEQLNLGELANNGGPTMTHALLTEPVVSVAIDVIPTEDCEVDADQRGAGRPSGLESRCDVGSFEVQVPFSCTEQGIRDAIAAGGGPHTFDCDGPQTVVTQAEIVIDNDAILDGEGNLTVDGNGEHRVFLVEEGVTAGLRGLTVTKGGWVEPRIVDEAGGGIFNLGTLSLANCSITQCSIPESANPMGGFDRGGGISNGGTLTMTNCTVSGNSAGGGGGGIGNGGTARVTNSTVSGNSYPAIWNHHAGVMTIASSTVSDTGEPGEFFGDITNLNVAEAVEFANSLIDGNCSDDVDDPGASFTSLGYNIESPGDTCGFDQTGDRAGVTAEQLNLGPLANNGGPTMTHKPGEGGLGDGSVAIDQIAEADCGAATDQRGQPRPEVGGTMCDVGAVEVQPEP